jgi:SAM-dependent methyltransferase
MCEEPCNAWPGIVCRVHSASMVGHTPRVDEGQLAPPGSSAHDDAIIATGERSQSHREHGTTPSHAAEPSSNGLFGRLRTAIYDNTVTSFTTKWYAEVLDVVPEYSRLLDVGIGTGTALLANANRLRAKHITVIGVDYDENYVEKCRALVHERGLSSHISCVCGSFYDFKPPDGLLFDHVYFSGSFMILPDRAKAVRKAVDLLVDREDGRLFFTQTFELRKNSFLEWLKPTMAYLTTIDFGTVTYVEDFDEALHEGGAIAVSTKKIEDGMSVEGARESRLVIARSDIYVVPAVEVAS